MTAMTQTTLVCDTCHRQLTGAPGESASAVRRDADEQGWVIIERPVKGFPPVDFCSHECETNYQRTKHHHLKGTA